MPILSKTASFEALPAEVIIEVVTNVEFTPSAFRDLHVIHKRLTEVLRNYEQSIAKSITLTQFPNALIDFPTAKSRSYSWLSKCSRRYDIIEDIVSILASYDNAYRVSNHNLSLVLAGFQLLYRLQDLSKYSSKVNLLKALPTESLISILLALFYSTNYACDYGAGIINGDYCHNIAKIRSDIEFAFMESGIKYGPQFIRDSLHKVAGADFTLFRAWRYGELRGLPDDGGLIIAKGTLDDPRELHRRTITSHLGKACADRMGCKPWEVMSRILDMIELPEHRLAWLRRPDRARLVLGLPLDSKVRERKVIEDVRALAIRDWD